MITATNTSTAAQAAASSTTTTTSTKNAAGSEDRFLKLLVAQLSNQDPMNPMDNAQMTSQMAQISTVTGVQQVNQAIQELSAQLASMQMLQSSSLVGRSVLVDGSKLPVTDGKASGAIDLVAAADSVKVDILSAGGKIIDTIDLGARAAGRQTFDWDAKGRMTSGTVSYRVTASQGGNSVATSTLASALVEGVSSDSGSMNVQLQNLGNVAYDKVRAIR
ncbi:MAG: flagellar hook assembly protein FlgD [Rhodoferax sp.]|jgi:flagellar basal-body rod modification protein FlgD|nr:flagellar hook assembly protein FlgD [Rhodoferax sp.]